MYFIVIIATFLCSDNTTVDKETHFENNKVGYTKAVVELDRLKKGIDAITEKFNDKECVLIDVRGGNRKK